MSTQFESELVWQFFGGRRDGFFLDVGANEPQKNSQTWFLEERGWQGILVEPQAELCQRLRQARPHARVYQVACGPPGAPPELPFYIAGRPGHSALAKNLIAASTVYVRTEMVKVLTLDTLLEQAGNPKVDFVSIDVEGTQLDVLRGFTLKRHRPALLLIEDHLYTLSAHRHLRQHGYRLVRRTGLNNWYVPPGTNLPFSTWPQRMRLWKRIWLNTPFRKLRVYLDRRKAENRGPS